MGENQAVPIVFRLIDRRNSQGAMGGSAGRLFAVATVRYSRKVRKVLVPLGLTPDAYLERAKARIPPLDRSFYSSRNAVYVCATSAPVAQPDRATDF